jgi:hypothetical protein
MLSITAGMTGEHYHTQPFSIKMGGSQELFFFVPAGLELGIFLIHLISASLVA